MDNNMENNFTKLASIDVGQHIEKKANLSYLSWAWAVDQLMRVDPAANWEFHEPKMYGETMMVSCTVTAFGKPVTMHLPVMDHRNKAIHCPDAFDVNKNMMRCLVKAIACHGLGLYIYAGEDLPHDDEPRPDVASILRGIANAKTLEILKANYEAAKQMLPTQHHPAINKATNARKAELNEKADAKHERELEAIYDESKYQ